MLKYAYLSNIIFLNYSNISIYDLLSGKFAKTTSDGFENSKSFLMCNLGQRNWFKTFRRSTHDECQINPMTQQSVVDSYGYDRALCIEFSIHSSQQQRALWQYIEYRVLLNPIYPRSIYWIYIQFVENESSYSSAGCLCIYLSIYLSFVGSFHLNSKEKEMFYQQELLCIN